MAATGFNRRLLLSIRRLAQTSTYSTAVGTNEKIGFIGLGNMGGRMVKNLLRNGRSLVVYDVVEKSVGDLVKAGAVAAGSPAEVAEQCKHIITMLPSSPHVKKVYCGDDGILTKVMPGTLMIDCSTIDTSVSQAMEIVSKEKKAIYMDAPVSGGVNGARDATLTFMIGGQEEDVKAVEGLLQEMGKNIVHCGPVSTGQATKICNNMMLGIAMTGVAETLNLGIRLGLDPKMLTRVMNTSSGRTYACELQNPVPGVLQGVPASNNYEGGFATALMAKDLGLAQNAAIESQSPTPLGTLAHDIYRVMLEDNNVDFSNMDFAAVFKFVQKMEVPAARKAQFETANNSDMKDDTSVNVNANLVQ